MFLGLGPTGHFDRGWCSGSGFSDDDFVVDIKANYCIDLELHTTISLNLLSPSTKQQPLPASQTLGVNPKPGLD